MPLARSHIRETAEAYLARHPDERESLAGLLSLLDGAADPAGRATLPGHVTCSAAVIDREQRVLHIGHKVTGLLLAPGGHVEDDRTLLAAALREVCEETGIRPGDLCLTPQFLGAPIDIDVHDIDASPSKGEPPHRHYDFRYVFYLAGEEPPTIVLQDEEVSGAQWLPQPEVTSPTLRAKLLAARLDGRPEPVNASALIHDGAGRYLLHLRDHRPGVIWQSGAFALLGGGRTHDDQSLEGTLLRELAEEVPDLRLEDLKPYAVEAATSIDGLSVPVRVFAGRWRGNPERLALHEGVLLRWFAPDELDRLRLSPATGDLIRRHAAESPPDTGSAAAPPVWDGGSRTVLNGVGVHLHLEDAEGRVLLGVLITSVVNSPLGLINGEDLRCGGAV
ncbi:NUDIX domain-containing protein [Streptomyces lydicus]|uniref:NUDIX hydrolase n=1 Tax=Streptomyces lydicus TaxID=47763 RepID=UPI0036FD4013